MRKNIKIVVIKYYKVVENKYIKILYQKGNQNIRNNKYHLNEKDDIN